MCTAIGIIQVVLQQTNVVIIINMITLFIAFAVAISIIVAVSVVVAVVTILTNVLMYDEQYCSALNLALSYLYLVKNL